MVRYPYAEWKYSAEYTVANPPAADGYQVMLTLPWRAGMRLDFRDIRFCDSALRKCPYLVETSTAGSTANVWVRLYAGQRRLSMLYGNPSATSESNGAAVFDFFDDFSGATIDTAKWDTSGTVTLTNGVMTGHISGKISFGAGYSLCGTARWPTINVGGQRNFSWVNVADPETYYSFNGHSSGQWILECNSPYHYALNMGAMDTNFHKWEIRRASSSSCDFYRDGSYKGSLYSGPTANLPPGIITGTGEWKTVYVRKFTATEPVLTRARSGLNPRGIGASRNPLTAGSPPPTYSETATVSIGVSTTGTARAAYHASASVNLDILAKGRDPVNYTESASVSLGVSVTAASTAGYHASASVDLGVSAPVATIIQTIDFSGTKAGASSVRRGITDSFWTLNQAIDEAQTLSLETLKRTKVIRQDKAGIEHCVFFGLLPDVTYQLAYCADGTNVIGYDYGWYLSEQMVPPELLTLPATQEPSTWVRAVLGGDIWERKTGVMSYRLHPIAAWGTTIPAKAFTFKRDTPISKAIKDVMDYYGSIFFTKWQNFGPIPSVSSSDPSRRLIVIGAADYDPISGTGYADYEPANLGGAYRPNEGADIELFATEKGYSVGWIRNGEWLKFTRDFPWSGDYALSFRVACMGAACYFTVSVDGVLLSTVHTGADYLTGDYSVFTNTDPDADGTIATLTAGSHEIRIEFGGNIGDAPNDQHQNLASITCTPRPVESEGTLTDDVFTPAAYLLAEDELDSTTDGLDLPAPRTFTNPSDAILNNVKIAQKASNAYNRVIVGGHDAQGVWWWVTREAAAVTAGEELAREISVKPDQCTTLALTEAYADDLLEYYSLDQQTYDLSVDQGMDLQLYQKVKFVGYERIPAGWCRIVDITYHCEYLNDYVEISVIPVERMAAQSRLYRSLFATNTTITEAIVNAALDAYVPNLIDSSLTASIPGTQALIDSSITAATPGIESLINSIVSALPVTLVGTVTAVGTGTTTVTVEGDGSQTWRCTE